MTTYFSIDIETDGPAAGLNNMLTLGVAAFDAEGVMKSTFYTRLVQLQGLGPDPQTLLWWRRQNSAAYKEAFNESPRGSLVGSITALPRSNALDSMLDFALWLNQFKVGEKDSKFIALAWPAAFDFPFVNYYCHRFLGENPLGYACLDIRSYIMGICRTKGYYDLKEEKVNSLFGVVDRTGLRAHVAVDDAIAQGKLFFQVRNHRLADPNRLIDPDKVV